MKCIYTKTFFANLLFLVLLLVQQSGFAVVIPKAPSRLAATAISPTQIDLTWVDNAADETGFELERSVDGLKFVKIADLGINAKTFSNTALPSSTKFWYRILSKNSAGKSAYSNIANATTLLAAPDAPENLMATAVSISQINLTWADSSDNEAGFQLERSLNGTAFTKIADLPANSKSYQSSNLSPATEYYFRVRAINAAGASAYSNIASATTDNIPVPEMPRDFTAVPIAPDVVQLRWAAVSANAKETIIERAKGNGGQFAQIGKVAANVLQFQDTDSLDNATNYLYRIKAVNAGGSSPYSLISIVLAQSIITALEPATGDNHIVYAFERTLFTQLDQPVSAHLQVYDLRGVQLTERKINAFSTTDLGSLSAGIYIVRIETDKEVITRKIALY
jgi:titin